MSLRCVSIFALMACCLSPAYLSAGSQSVDVEGLSPVRLQEATSINAMSTELLAARLDHGGLSNAMVSSVSLYYALAMLTEGADKETRDLLNQRLMRSEGSELNVLAPALAQAITSPFIDGGPQGAFSLSNSLWSNSGSDAPPSCHSGRPFEFRESFLARGLALYGANHQSLDFASPDATGAINAWIKEQTRELISEVIDQEVLKCLDWTIVNAATFEGGWAESTQRLPRYDGYRFTDLEGISQTAETIRVTDYVAPIASFPDGSTAFELPFFGGKYAFVVHTAPENTVDMGSWLIQDSLPGFQALVKSVLSNSNSPNQLTIQMPVFAFSDSIEMDKDSPLPRALDIDRLFSPTAEFGRLSEQPSFVRIIKQDTRLEFNENGVSAAAVTVIGGRVGVTSVRRSFPRREIVVDRPFSFAIVERSTGTILFNGVLTSLDATQQAVQTVQ